MIKIIEDGHSVPESVSMEATRRTAELCRKAVDDTLLINIISGGGSTLLSYPTKTETEKINTLNNMASNSFLDFVTLNLIKRIRNRQKIFSDTSLMKMDYWEWCLIP